MLVDLTAPGSKYPIDCTRHRSLRLQCRPVDGNPSTGVVEVKRAFSGDLSTPSVSMPTTTTLTLDGSAVTDVDVTDVAWVHVAVTTAESSVSVDVTHALGGPMSGSVRVVDIDADAVDVRGVIGSDGAYRASILVQNHEAVSTGVFDLRHALEADYPVVAFSPSVALTLDGSTVTAANVDTAGVLAFNCTTAQIGLRARAYVYLRGEVVADSASSSEVASGTSFPSAPVDGQPFYRTDLDIPELFHYDATRAKWLGELRMWSFSRAQALSSGSMGLQYVSVVLASSRGLITPAALTVVGIEFSNINSGVTCDIDLYEDATNLVTLLSPTLTETAYDHTLDYDIDADAASPKKWVQINNISAGTLSNPIVVLYLRRHET